MKDLLLRSDPYSIKNDLCTVNRIGGYKHCVSTCDSCTNFVMETDHIKRHATGKVFKIRNDITCSTPNVIYCAQCMKCFKQGVGSTTNWKPRLRNYKSHIVKKLSTCSIVDHFINCCRDDDDPTRFLKFTIIDSITNYDGLSLEEIDTLLLTKEKFWIGTLITQHKGMNSTHDWNRKLRSEKAK